MKTDPVHIHLAEGDYVIIPRAEYMRLRGEGNASGGLLVPSTKVALLAEMGRQVRLAREHAGLSQAALAKRLRVTQAMISRAESGRGRISGAYIGRVLKACELPSEWRPSE